MVFWITYKDLQNNKRTKWLDFLLFFSTGLVGLLVLLLWFATDHSATANNYNFLWAFLPNVVCSFFLLKNEVKTWIKYYLILIIILLLVAYCIVDTESAGLFNRLDSHINLIGYEVYFFI